MAKPPPSPPSKDQGHEASEAPDAKRKGAEQEEVTREHSSGRPPQTKR